jgi:hypothetical protein
MESPHTRSLGFSLLSGPRNGMRKVGTWLHIVGDPCRGGIRRTGATAISARNAGDVRARRPRASLAINKHAVDQ